MWTVRVRHRDGSPAESVGSYDTPEEAVEAIEQQGIIMQGYNRKAGWANSIFCVYAPNSDDIETAFWIKEE